MFDSGRLYNIVCMNNMGLFIPPGAERSPQPLQGMPVDSVPPSHIRVEKVGGDKYKLIPMQCPDRVIAAYRDASPKLILLASPDDGQYCHTEWAIEPSGPGTFQIHAADGQGNEYWTSEGNGVGIRLGGSEGKESQQWQFRPVDY